MSLDAMYVDLDTHHIEGFAYHGNTPFYVPLVSHITGNLWTGGCYHKVRLPDDFAYVVSLYQWERYDLGPDTVRHEVEMYDADDDLGAGERLYDLAEMVNAYRAKGKTLVHCQAGLNRSSLIAALALIIDGMPPAEAIGLLREKRSPAVLCNQTFERWLLDREADRG